MPNPPARYAFPITPHNSTEISPTPRAIYVGAAGDITAVLVGDPGTEVLFKSVPVGTILDIQPLLIKASGTGASQILGLY